MVGEEFKFVQRPASHLRAINKIHCELYQMPAFEYAGLSQRANCQLSSPHVFPPRLARAVGLRKAREGALRLGARVARMLCTAAERSSLRHAAGAPRVARAARGHSAPSTGAFGPITSLSHKFQHLFPCALYFPRRAVDVQDPVHKSLVVTQHVTGSMHHVIRDELLTIHTGPSTHEINASVHV